MTSKKLTEENKFSNIPLNNFVHTIYMSKSHYRIYIYNNIKDQLIQNLKFFESFSLVLDTSCDITHCSKKNLGDTPSQRTFKFTKHQLTT